MCENRKSSLKIASKCQEVKGKYEDNYMQRGSIKPNNPSAFYGKRDRLTVDTWPYGVLQYLNLVAIGHPEITFNIATRITSSPMFLKGTGVNWWYVKVQADQIPDSLTECESTIGVEFFPQDSLRQVREKNSKIGSEFVSLLISY